MDALPLTEDSSRPCCSLNPGHMHACGHDAHVAITLGTARILMEARSEWSGCVKFFFQPAEETTGEPFPWWKRAVWNIPAWTTSPDSM
ncbi:MAG: M20/M25/M40 family metallo-hydrolase [Enterocloster clostridioformis]